MYGLLRALLFRLPAETAHDLGTTALRGALSPRGVRRAWRRRAAAAYPVLAVERMGLHLPTPLGLAAGFDKAARTVNPMLALGFGFVEVGTVTRHPQPGNPKPRLFRLADDRALVNRMGFNNPGAAAVAERLEGLEREGVVGVNLGKSRVAPLERAEEDYLASLELLAPHADYLVVNVSSPNTPGLRTLQDAGPLRRLMEALARRNREIGTPAPPILLKIAPDLADADVDAVCEVAGSVGIAGVVATNTTVDRSGLRTSGSVLERVGQGGLSGRPLRARALDVVRRLRRRLPGEATVIGVGGIFDADDAWRTLAAGADLIQAYTGFVYGGPGFPRRINEGLASRLAATGLQSVTEITGSELPPPEVR